jgi:hypothetical protein
MNRKKIIYSVAGSLGLIALMAIAMHLEGRLTQCACGYIKLWHGVVVSSENSQHLFDWYTFTHVSHGLMIYFLLWLADRKKKLSFTAKLLFAIGIEAAWEVLENSDMVINRYRAATISLDYFGDSIVNSTGDVLAMIAGFIFAYRARVWLAIALFIALEALLIYAIRDSLMINIVMLIHPIEALKSWQSGL